MQSSTLFSNAPYSYAPLWQTTREAGWRAVSRFVREENITSLGAPAYLSTGAIVGTVFVVMGIAEPILRSLQNTCAFVANASHRYMVGRLSEALCVSEGTNVPVPVELPPTYDESVSFPHWSATTRFRGLIFNHTRT